MHSATVYSVTHVVGLTQKDIKKYRQLDGQYHDVLELKLNTLVLCVCVCGVPTYVCACVCLCPRACVHAYYNNNIYESYSI